MMKLLRVPLRFLWRKYLKMRFAPKRISRILFSGDLSRFLKYSGACNRDAKEAKLASIVLHSHIIEKGLTMPGRRLGFGEKRVEELMAAVHGYVQGNEIDDARVKWAIQAIKEYEDLHRREGFKTFDRPGFADALHSFCEEFSEIAPSSQRRFTRDGFYGDIECAFPRFAASRHTVRNYSPDDVPVNEVRKAVALAQTAPSACNRQYCKVYCVSDRRKFPEILELQSGNRGFGHLANKILVVTADLLDITSAVERNDLFTNGGIFLMNLCYSLHYFKIAHCILNWSKELRVDREMHRLLDIPQNEAIIAVLTCGYVPLEFDVALSQRRELKDIFFER